MKLSVSFKSFVKGAIFISFFISCSDSNLPETEVLSEKKHKNTDLREAIKPKDFGVYHNKVLSIFLNGMAQDKNSSESKEGQNDFGSFDDFKNLISKIKETVDKEDPSLIGGKVYEETIKNVEEVYRSFDNEDKDLNYYLVTERLFELKTSDRIGSLFLDLLFGNDSFNEVLIKVDRFRQNNDLSVNEENQLDRFEVTLHASKQLWDAVLKNRPNATFKCNPDEQQYLADAFGALLGGPAAVAYSYAIYKLQHDGDHCI